MDNFDRDLLFKVRFVPSDNKNYEKGEYIAKYYNSDDIHFKGKDGQHIRFTFNDFCEVVEIFPLSKPVLQRYDNFFQKTYGKMTISSKNILPTFNVKYHNKIKDAPDNSDYSLNMIMSEYNIMFSEKSPYKLQNMILGNELVNVLEDILKVIDVINQDISMHVHTNVSTSVNYRVTQISKQIKVIKDYLPNILSINNFLN